MTFQESCEQLVRWMDESLGQHIEIASGEKYCFRLTADYTEDEVEDFEDEWDLDFPEPYRTFLLKVGACEIFYGGAGKGRGISVTRLQGIKELYHEYFDRQNSLLFERYLPIGCEYGRQLIAVLDLSQESATVALFPDELQSTDWDDWAGSHQAWMPFDQWITGIVSTHGEGDA